jgi:hypothetical protein
MSGATQDGETSFETRQMRRAQTDPKLVAYVELREEFINFGHLYIQNVGAGPALDVSFELLADNDDEGGELLINDFKKTRFLDTGVDYIGPNQKLRSRYSRFNDAFEKKIKAKLTVKIKYKNSTKQSMSDVYSIDMSQFEGAGSLGTPHLHSIAESLKKFQDDFHSFYNGFHHLKVDTYTSDDRKRESEIMDERT